MGGFLVTGASGLLGDAVAREAAARGASVVGTFQQHRLDGVPYALVRLDLDDRADAERVVGSVHPAAVIHCAALTNVDACEAEPDRATLVNGVATGALARAAARVGAAFLYVSSDGVFDGTRGWYTEEDECRPLNAYAASKRRGEEEALSGHPGAVVARLAPFGWSPRAARASLAEWVLNELKAGREIRGFTDAIFTPLYTRTLATLFLATLDRGLQGIYHMGSRDACSKAEFARRLATRAGLNPALITPVTLASQAFRAARPGNVSLATTKLTRDLGRAMPALADEIDAFFRAAPRERVA